MIPATERSSTGVASPTASTYVVTVTRGSQEILSPIVDAWQALCAEGPCDDPRLTPWWIAAYLEAFAPEAKLALITIRADNQLRGVLPLIEHRAGFGPFGVRWLRSASNAHSTRFELIHGKDDADRVVDAMLAFLQKWTRWNVLHLRTFARGDALDSLLHRAAEATYLTTTRGEINAWYVPIDGSQRDIDAAIAGRSKSLRKQLRRDLARLREHGDLRLRIYNASSDAASFQHAMDTFYDLEAAGWKGRAGSAIASAEDTRHFYDLVSSAGRSRDLFALYALELDDRMVSASFGVVAGNRFLSLKTTYDESLGAFSPGHLITAYMLADGAVRDYVELDLGGTPATLVDYKSAWTSQSRAVVTGFIFSHGLRGRIAYLAVSRVAPWIEVRLPQAKSRLQQWWKKFRPGRG